METIKFRAWDKVLKRISEVSCINFFDEIVILDETNMGHVTQKLSDVVLMQYTGLKDKNGKEIYAGDIIKKHCRTYSPGEGEVASCDINIEVKNMLDFYKYYWSYETEDLEIIGNIYENPELLNNQSDL